MFKVGQPFTFLTYNIELLVMKDAELQAIGEKVVDVLRTIYDPEIPVDVYELGLIYDVAVSDECDVHILMTLTSPNCPVAESLPEEIKEKTRSVDEVRDVEVEITFDPPWTKDMMSEEAMLELGFL